MRPDQGGDGFIEPLLVISGRVNSVVPSSAILIDSGATSIFISRGFVDRHRLREHVLPDSLQVRLADGSLVRCTAYVPRALLEVRGYRGRHDFIILPETDGFDIILGRRFLVLSRAVVHHASSSLSFEKLGSGSGDCDSVAKASVLSATVLPVKAPIACSVTESTYRTAAPCSRSSPAVFADEAVPPCAVVAAVGVATSSCSVSTTSAGDAVASASAGFPGESVSGTAFTSVTSVGEAVSETAMASVLPSAVGCSSSLVDPLCSAQSVCSPVAQAAFPRKVKVASLSSQAAKFASLVAEIAAGQSEARQDDVLRACGITASTLHSDVVPMLPFVDGSVQARVAVVVREYEERMKPFVGTLPPSRGDFDHAIKLIDPNSRPRARRAIPLSERHLKSLAKEIEKLLSAGLIRPSRSEWAAPVFFVPKDEKEDRMIIDLRQLNELTETNNSSLPYTKELFSRLRSAVLFSKLDLKSGYHQLRLRESDIPFTGFITPLGHFEWLVTPFGEKNSPASFAQMMSQLVLPDILHLFVLVFQDDILIASNSVEEHASHVQQVLERLSAHRLWINPEKCQWAVREVDFLGHHLRVTADGTVIEPCQSKIDAVVQWPCPTNRAELGAFLGLANFYRSFVNGFSDISAPLTSLSTPKKPFVWLSEHQDAFVELKRALSSAPALLSADSEKPFVLHCDASSFAVGAVLSQHDGSGQLRPVGFYSSKLTDVQLRWDVYQREIYSVVAALQHWFFHLKGSPFRIQIFTDHQSLEELNFQLLRPKLARWFTVLSEYKYDVTWIPAELNAAADALSRRPDHDDGSEHRRLTETLVAQEAHFYSGNSLGPGSLLSPSEVVSCRPRSIVRQSAVDASCVGPVTAVSTALASVVVSASPSAMLSRIREGYCLDESCASILTDPALHGYRLVDGLLMRHGSSGVLVPEDEGLRKSILEEMHDIPISGHVGVVKTIARLASSYYWPGMSRDATRHVLACLPCQQNKGATQKPPGLLKPLPIAQKGELITLDFIGPLPRSRHQMDSILVVVDKMTKRVYYEACRSTITAKQTAAIVFRRVIREQGFPKAIVSDRDSRFTSVVWRELWSACGTKLALATAYHQQSDGQSERQVRTLEEGLRAFVNAAGTNWDERLPHIELAHNTAKHASTGFAPLQLHSGVSAGLPVSLGLPRNELLKSSGARVMELMSSDILQAQAALKLAQERQKRAYDLRHRHVVFKVGDYAFLSSADRAGSVKGKRVWRPLWEGPYKVLDVTCEGLNVTLELPASMRIHPVFHVSKLKKAILPLSSEFPPLSSALAAEPPVVEDTGMKSGRAALSHSDNMLPAEELADAASVETYPDRVTSPLPGVGVDFLLEDESGYWSEDTFDSAVSDSPSELLEPDGADASLMLSGPQLRRSGRSVVPTSRFMHEGQLGRQLGFI